MKSIDWGALDAKQKESIEDENEMNFKRKSIFPRSDYEKHRPLLYGEITLSRYWMIVLKVLKEVLLSEELTNARDLMFTI